MSERVLAYDIATGEKTLINWRWVDNPAISGGRYVSKKPRPKSSRTKREPVEIITETTPIVGDSTEETS